MLAQDPSSWYVAKKEGWTRPLDTIEDRLSDLLQVYVNANKPKGTPKFTIPRPYEKKEKATAVPVEKARAYFAKMGHKNTKPTKLPAGFLPEK